MKALQEKETGVKRLFVTECLGFLNDGKSLDCIIRCDREPSDAVRVYHIKYEACLDREEIPVVSHKEELSFGTGYSDSEDLAPFKEAFSYVKKEFSGGYKLSNLRLFDAFPSFVSWAGFRVTKN